MNKIKMISHQYAFELLQARKDQSAITGQPLIERPFWFEDIETGQTYYDLFGCIGFPTEVSDAGRAALPGYVAIVGVVKPKSEGESVRDATFKLLAEYESKDVPSLLDAIVSMRKEYGFGLHPGLLQSFFGDPERFITTIALKNERLIAKDGDRAAILVTPPYDFYNTMVFDEYFRALQSVLMPGRVRLFFGKCKILREHLREFTRDNPAVLAVGGLMQTLLVQSEWMEANREAAFVIEDGGF